MPLPKPELRLRIIPEKQMYVLNETLFTSTEFTNLTDKTLCFPEPEQRHEDPVVGFIAFTGTGPHGREWDHFTDHYDGTMPSDEKLMAEMQHTWIKLAPNQIYVTNRSAAPFILNSAGEWKLRAVYHPPVAPFAAEKSRIKLQLLGERVGCAPPQLDAFAPATKVHVVQSSQ